MPESLDDLGRYFGATLTEAEVRYLIEREWAQSAEDILWRRTKLGLRLSADEKAALESWIKNTGGMSSPKAAHRAVVDIEERIERPLPIHRSLIRRNLCPYAKLSALVASLFTSLSGCGNLQRILAVVV